MNCCVNLDESLQCSEPLFTSLGNEIRAPHEESVKRLAQLVLAPSKCNILGVTVTVEIAGTHCHPPTPPHPTPQEPHLKAQNCLNEGLRQD